METYEEIRVRWMDVKSQYSDLIQKRLTMLVDGDFESLTAQNGGASEYFDEEVSLFNKAEGLREQLRELRPEEYAFGKRNTSFSSISFYGREFSRYGDNGYFICEECKGLFECPSQKKLESRKGNYHSDSFKKCSDHIHIKKSATMYANLGDIEWL